MRPTQVGDDWREREATEWGCIPLPHQEDFAFWGLKVSDIMHTLVEFVGILYIENSIGK